MNIEAFNKGIGKSATLVQIGQEALKKSSHLYRYEMETTLTGRKLVLKHYEVLRETPKTYRIRIGSNEDNGPTSYRQVVKNRPGSFAHATITAARKHFMIRQINSINAAKRAIELAREDIKLMLREPKTYFNQAEEKDA